MFEEAHGTGSFPWHRPLPSGERLAVLARVSGALGGAAGVTADVPPGSFDPAFAVPHVDAAAADFDLRAVLAARSVDVRGTAFFDQSNWRDMDEMRLADVCACFADLWNPAADDVLVCPADVSWVLTVCHNGLLWFRPGRDRIAG